MNIFNTFAMQGVISKAENNHTFLDLRLAIISKAPSLKKLKLREETDLPSIKGGRNSEMENTGPLVKVIIVIATVNCIDTM
jgi:hypothetical protein